MHFSSKRTTLKSKSIWFLPSDSYINELLSVTHEIFQFFDGTPSPNVRSVFLDISKTFDKDLHEGLLSKLNSVGISVKFCKLLKVTFSNLFQRVVLIGKALSWGTVLAGVLQGSILGPLPFLIYLNDMTSGLKSNVKLFTDAASIFNIFKNKNDTA